MNCDRVSFHLTLFFCFLCYHRSITINHTDPKSPALSRCERGQGFKTSSFKSGNSVGNFTFFFLSIHDCWLVIFMYIVSLVYIMVILGNLYLSNTFLIFFPFRKVSFTRPQLFFYWFSRCMEIQQKANRQFRRCKFVKT